MKLKALSLSLKDDDFSQQPRNPVDDVGSARLITERVVETKLFRANHLVCPSVRGRGEFVPDWRVVLGRTCAESPSFP